MLNDLGESVFDGVRLTVSRAEPMPFYFPSCSIQFLSPTVFPFSSFMLWVGKWDWDLMTDWVLIALSQPYIANFFK